MVKILNKPYSGKKRGHFQTEQMPRPRHNQAFKGRVFSLPRKQILDGSIEAGLLCLTAWRRKNPGHSLTRDEIAFVCGCRDSAIWRIEMTALKKLKKKLADFRADLC